MTLETRAELRSTVMKDEGTGPVKNGRFLPYLDCCGKFWRECKCEPKGVLTIGWGHSLDRGLTPLESEVLLDHDLADAEGECVRAFPWFQSLNAARQKVVANMVFNLGLPKFQEFKQTIAAIQIGNYAGAAAQMLASKWARQVKGRAVRLASVMRDGR